VVADNGGGRDYAIDRENALVVEPKRPDLLADAVDRLFSDKAFRIRLAEAGRRTVQQFKWTTAVDELERVLLGLCR
jgi:glycosyltransferase involved in cell wall biosynthesis